MAAIVKIEQKDGEVIIKGSDGTEVGIMPADDSDTAYPVANSRTAIRTPWKTVVRSCAGAAWMSG
jgi:hypothetical protein